MKIDLRPAESDDFERLFALKETSYRAYVETLWGRWDPADQRQRFLESFRDPALQVVELDGRFAGSLTVHDEEDPVELADIELLPEAQGHGVGTWLVGEVVARARARDRDVVLRVLRPNPAQAWYERLGFVAGEQTDTHVSMRWSGDADARRALKLAREPWTDPARRDGWLHDVFADEVRPWVQWLQFVTGRAGMSEPGRALEIGCETGRRLKAIQRARSLDAEERTVTEQQAAARRLVESLTRRESQILRLIVQGKLNKQMAADLGISQKTVEFHRARVMRKLEVSCMAELMRVAFLSGVRDLYEDQAPATDGVATAAG